MKVKKEKAKIAAIEKKKKDKLAKAKKIEDAFEKLKKTHGGLDGQQNTGYDDDQMS